MAIDSKPRRQAALLDQPLVFPDGSLANAQDRAWMLLSYFDPAGSVADPLAPVGGSIHEELNTELFFSEVAVASAQSLVGWNVSLAGHRYLIDVTKYQRSTLGSSAPQQDTSAEPGENSLSREGFWSRQQVDWRHGAGQRFFDAEGADRARFLQSTGTDPWTPYELDLLNDVEQKRASVNTNLECFEVGGKLWMVDGANLLYTTDPTVQTPTFTSLAAGATILDVTTDGDRIYLALGGSGLKTVNVSTPATPATLGVLTPNLVQFANGRLIGAAGKLLYEIKADGTKVDIRDDPRSAFTWVAVTGSPTAIFAAGTVGQRSEFYAVTATDTATNLGAPRFAGHLPFGETIRTLISYAQIVAIGTSAGLRGATVDNNTINYGELIAIPGGVDALSPHGQFCWFSWSDYGSSTGLGRADLSVSTSEETFVPAWASDLQARNTQGTVKGVCTFGDRRYFTASGSGLWGETIYKVPFGTIETGQIRYGTLAHKLFTSVALRHEPLAGQIGAEVIGLDGSSRSLGLSTIPGDLECELADAQVAGLSMSLRLTLVRDIDATKGPRIRAWTLSALPRPKRVTEFIVPLILKSRVTDLANIPARFDPLAEVQFLEGLASSSELVTYQEGSASYTVRVDTVAIPEQGVRSWQDDSSEGVWFECSPVYVRLLSKES